MFNIVIIDEARQHDFECKLFQPEAKRRFVDFCEFAGVLNQTSFVKNLPKSEVCIHVGNDGKIRNQGVLPSDEEIAAFLHRLRPFYLQNEDCNFVKIANTVSEHFRQSPEHPIALGATRGWAAPPGVAILPLPNRSRSAGARKHRKSFRN